MEVEQPNKNIYEINGSIIFNGQKENKKYFNIKNVAIRGAKLKNTEFIYGIIIYTGNDTKIMKNIVKHRVKSANIDKWVDNIVLIILILRFIYIIIFMLIGMMIRYKYLPSYNDSDKDKIVYDYLFYYRHYNKQKECCKTGFSGEIRMDARYRRIKIIFITSVCCSQRHSTCESNCKDKKNNISTSK